MSSKLLTPEDKVYNATFGKCPFGVFKTRMAVEQWVMDGRCPKKESRKKEKKARSEIKVFLRTLKIKGLDEDDAIKDAVFHFSQGLEGLPKQIKQEGKYAFLR